jgi:hypothetical protein
MFKTFVGHLPATGSSGPSSRAPTFPFQPPKRRDSTRLRPGNLEPHRPVSETKNIFFRETKSVFN